jgi:hypothetical protein
MDDIISSEEALQCFIDRQQAAGNLSAQHGSHGVIRLLAHVVFDVLPAYGQSPARDSLEAFRLQTTIQLLHQHRLAILHGLKAAGIAKALQLKPSTLRVYRCHLSYLLRQIDAVCAKSLASSNPYLRLSWEPLIQRRDMEEEQRTALKRFAAYCSARGMEIEDVDATAVEVYQIWLRVESGLKNWRSYYGRLERVWLAFSAEGLVDAVDFAPLPRKHALYGMRWEELPAHLADGFALYERLATTDDMDRCLGQAPVKESTIECNRATYLDYLGFLWHVDAVDLGKKTLPELLQRHHLESFHAYALQRAQGKAMAWHMRRLFFLRYFAQRVVSPHIGPVETSWLDELMEKTTPSERKEHVPEYTRQMVEQVLHMLDMHIAEAEKNGRPSYWTIPLYTAHFIIAFLADHPVRGINLRTAYLGKEFTPDVRRFRASTKNGQIVEEGVSAAARESFLRYAAARKRAGIHSTAMLVSRQGRPLGYSGFHGLVVRWFRRGANIHFTPHCFRYLAVGEALERTGDPVYAGAAIGDRSGKVVEKSYNRYSMSQATRAWYALNAAFRQDEKEALPPPVQFLLERARADADLLARIKVHIEREGCDEKREVA